MGFLSAGASCRICLTAVFPRGLLGAPHLQFWVYFKGIRQLQRHPHPLPRDPLRFVSVNIGGPKTGGKSASTYSVRGEQDWLEGLNFCERVLRIWVDKSIGIPSPFFGRTAGLRKERWLKRTGSQPLEQEQVNP